MMAVALGRRQGKITSGDVDDEITRIEEEIRRLEGEQTDVQRELTEAEALHDDLRLQREDLTLIDQRLVDLREAATQKAQLLPRAKRYLESLRRPLWEAEHREKSGALERHLARRPALARRMVEAQIGAVEATQAWAEWVREGRQLALAANAVGKRIGAAELNDPNDHILGEAACAPIRVLTGKELSERVYDRVLTLLGNVLNELEGGTE